MAKSTAAPPARRLIPVPAPAYASPVTADVQGPERETRDPPLQRGSLALYAGFLLLIAAVLSSIWFTIRQQDSFGRISHTLRVQSEIERVTARLQQAETGSRGFLLTGRSDFLQPYEEAIRELPRDLARLRDLVSDNPAQLAQVDGLRTLAAARMRFLGIGVQYYWRGLRNPPENFIRGQAIMDRFRDVAAAMKASEDQLLAERNQRAAREARLAALALGASAILVILLLLLAIRANRRRLAEAIAARDALAEANRRLTEEGESRAAAEATIRQMQKIEAVGQLTGGIAHDFNNMLAVVIGSLDMAQKRLERGETPRAVRLVENAMDGARRATALTARLLAFSRQQALDPQPLDVNALVGGMSEILLRTIGDDIRIDTVLSGGLWSSFADPGQLENAILNLAINARDAMPRGGRLVIETANRALGEDGAHPEAEADQVMIALADTGLGMEPEVLERALDPFFTTKGPGKGTGLGLSQVYGFIRQTGGHLAIESAPGEGTTVRIYLPRHADGEGPRAPSRAGQPEVPAAARGEVVLVVEDDERVRTVSVEALRDLGYTVVQAADASQALAVLALQPRVDLLFTDVVMPDVNGRELADKARAARPDLRVLFTTGYTRDAIVRDGILNPDVDLLPKPFTLEQLAAKVRLVLDRAE